MKVKPEPKRKWTKPKPTWTESESESGDEQSSSEKECKAENRPDDEVNNATNKRVENSSKKPDEDNIVESIASLSVGKQMDSSTLNFWFL